MLVRPPLWLWPERFYNWGYWLATDLLQTGLALGAALELNWRAYGHLEPGRRRASRILAAVSAAILCVALSALHAADHGAPDFFVHASAAVDAVTGGGAFLFAVFLGLAWWHRLPTDPFHRDVAAGFILWSLLMACSRPLGVLDPYVGIGRGGFERIAHVLVLAGWVQAAWRRPAPTTLEPAVLAFLQPWRRTA